MLVNWCLHCLHLGRHFPSMSTTRKCIHIVLQNVLDKLIEWSNRWGMLFNIQKCVLMSFKRKLFLQYNMSGILLEEVSNLCDLGVTIDNKLK